MRPKKSRTDPRHRYDVTAVLPYYLPETSGHCMSFMSLLPYLAEHGLKTAVLTSNRLYSKASVKLCKRDHCNGVDIVRFPMPPVRRRTVGGVLFQSILFNIQAALRLLMFPTRSVLCITSPPLLFVLLALICRIRGIPILLWAMDLYPEVLVETQLVRRKGVFHRFTCMVARWGYRHCEHIFTLGPVMDQRLRSHGVPEHKLTCVHNWAPDSIQYRAEQGNLFLRELELEGRFVALYSGNMGVVHTFDTFIAAARLLVRTCPEVLFLFVGDGPQRSYLEEQTRALRNVRIMDYVPFERLSESLSVASVSLASLRPGLEGVIAPCKIYASLKLGIPVLLVQERESDLSRVFTEDVEGRIVRPGDAPAIVDYIVELRSDPQRLRAARRANAQWYQSHCALDANAGAFLECLNGLLSSR